MSSLLDRAAIPQPATEALLSNALIERKIVMDKNTILQKAQNEKDEREVVIENKAGNIAGGIMFTLLAAVALLMTIGYDMDFIPHALNTRSVGAMLIMAGCLYTLIYDIYQIAVLKKAKKIASLVCFSVLFVYALVSMIHWM